MFTSRFDLCQSSFFGQQPINCVSQPDLVCRVPPHRKHRIGQPVSRARNPLELIQSELGRRTIAGVGPIARAVFCPSDTLGSLCSFESCLLMDPIAGDGMMRLSLVSVIVALAVSTAASQEPR